ncbi:MAG: hypothetical protein ACYDBQ_12145 [Thermoplasmatota archaeon]
MTYRSQVGTTVWLDAETREALRRTQGRLGEPSAGATIRRLLDRPELDARTLFALHRAGITTESVRKLGDAVRRYLAA